MDLSPHNFVSVNTILADVLKTVKDPSTKLNSRGWYTSQIQQALEELSFDTFFSEHNQAFDMPDNLRLDMPKGAFNLKNIYLFNGDDCTIGATANVYWKRNFINGRSGSGYVANDHWSNENDRFHKKRGFQGDDRQNHPEKLNFFGIQNGQIMLSESCRGFEKVMLVYNGILTDIGEAPVVPQFFRQAVKDYVTVKALEQKSNDMVGTNEYGHWVNMLNRYEARLNQPYDGSWAKAEYRSKQLNNKVRSDVKEYFTRLNY